ncbi:esterase FE4-like isoform X1 [Schistocerca nitens]|uniref:esterase FE4-like isoform X1 n=1 Tax=Schistocerca nitens TaxID=7011 RepID=UPI002117A078|nr:esterase FE4-like isoform X1 [Schistocerca nitens]
MRSNLQNCFAVIFLIQYCVAQSNYVTVQTSLGSLRGQAEQSVSGQTMYTFKGVPYAEPPVGTLRFQPPVAKEPWDGVRDALAAGSMCVQLDTGADRGQEDCLFLNVYTPELPTGTTTLRPVMVFIHGGGFVNGAGITYGPDYFVEAGVVAVTINYRLGPLGFLSTEDLVVPGNMGMKDQVQALRWVQQNIAVFGGDPNSVTIFGQSAGGASVHYLVLSPLAKGLFHKAIAESGAALNPWAFARNTRDRAYRLAQSFGYSGANNTTDIVQFLLTVDAYQLVSNPYAALPMEDIMGIFQMVFVPSVEPQHDGAFLTGEPTVLLSQGAYNDVPYMTGGTSAECLFFVAPSGGLSTAEQIAQLDQNFELMIGPDLRLPTAEQRTQGAREVRSFYYGDATITLQQNSTTVACTSALLFGEGIDVVVQRMAQHSTQPIYYYYFSYVGPLTSYPGLEGAGHGNEVNYMFHWGGGENLQPGSEGAITRSRLIQMWTNFARYGNPTPTVDSVITQYWTPYTSDGKAYLHFDVNLSIESNLKYDEFNFWHNLLP